MVAPYRAWMTAPDTRPYVWMLAGSFSFAMMAEFAHVLTRACDWQLVAVARAGLVALLAAVIALLAGAKLVFWPWRLWVRSIAGSFSMVFTFYSFGKLPAADVLTLTNTFPIWVALLSWPLYGQPPGAKIVLAIAVGIVGVVLVAVGPGYNASYRYLRWIARSGAHTGIHLAVASSHRELAPQDLKDSITGPPNAHVSPPSDDSHAAQSSEHPWIPTPADINEPDDTAALDSDALVAHDLLVHCVLATEPQPPLLTDADRTRPGRRLRVLVDVTADVTSHLNLLPVSDLHTSWAEPVRRIWHEPVPLDAIVIDNLPSLLPKQASDDFSSALVPLLPGLFAGDAVWQRAAQTYQRSIEGLQP